MLRLSGGSSLATTRSLYSLPYRATSSPRLRPLFGFYRRGNYSDVGGMLIRTMDQLVDWYGAPKSIRMDNGPEMSSREFVAWAQRRGIALNHIEPGEPNQNAYVKRFNRTFRTEVLDA